MIETKEQYERFKDQLSRATPQGEIDYAWTVAQTIEALREVARAGQSLYMLLGAVGALQLRGMGPDGDALQKKLDDLPDWITDG